MPIGFDTKARHLIKVLVIVVNQLHPGVTVIRAGESAADYTVIHHHRINDIGVDAAELHPETTGKSLRIKLRQKRIGFQFEVIRWRPFHRSHVAVASFFAALVLHFKPFGNVFAFRAVSTGSIVVAFYAVNIHCCIVGQTNKLSRYAGLKQTGITQRQTHGVIHKLPLIGEADAMTIFFGIGNFVSPVIEHAANIGIERVRFFIAECAGGL